MVLDEIKKSDTNDAMLKKDDKYTEICSSQNKISPTLLKRKLVNSLSTEREHKSRKIEKSKMSNTCFHCNKKLKMFNTYQCRCGNDFCNRHRFFDQHNCIYDIKNEAQKILKEANPKVVPKKL